MAREKAGALVMLMFSLAYGYLATRIQLTFLAQQEFFTPRTMPYALAVAGALLSLLILLQPVADPQGSRSLAQQTRGMAWGPALLLLLLMVLYGIAITWLGFIVASILFLLAGFYILGERRIGRMLLAAVPLVVVLWLLMSRLLGVYIAPGELFYLLGIL